MSAAVVNEAPLLMVRNLSTRFRMGSVDMMAVRGIDLEVQRREVLGIIGESGSGKSVTGLSLLRLLPAHATVTADHLSFAGRELLPLGEEDFRRLRGTHLAMVFQDPVGAFNPAKSIGWHLDRIMPALRPARIGKVLTSHKVRTDG